MRISLTPGIFFFFCAVQSVTRLLCSANDATRRLDGRDLAGHTGKFDKIENGASPCPTVPSPEPEPEATSPSPAKTAAATGATLALGVTAVAVTFLGLLL
jgi:hypothetical protein